MTILAIDPSTGIVGFAAVRVTDCGTPEFVAAHAIDLKAAEKVWRREFPALAKSGAPTARMFRVQTLKAAAMAFAGRVSPLSCVAVEQPNMRGPQAVAAIHQAIAACYCNSYCHAIPLLEINSATVKKAQKTAAFRQKGESAEDLHEKARGVVWASERFPEAFPEALGDGEREAIADALGVAVVACERFFATGGQAGK